MPSFLASAFLAGLVALIVPVLVHLRLRERKKSVEFPSLMFIRKIPHKSYRRRTLQNLALFLARAAAIVLLCLAFARPYFPRSTGGAAASAGTLARVIALDVSASMRTVGTFPRALAQASAALEGMSGNDLSGVVLFSDRVEGGAPLSTDHDAAKALVSAATPGSGATRFAPALRVAGEWLASAKADRLEVVFVTDGQARAIRGVADVSLPPGTRVTTVSVAPSSVDNAAVSDVSVEQAEVDGRRQAVVTARLLHQGGTERTLSASLEIGGRKVETRTVALPASGAVSVAFAPAPLPAGTARSRVLLDADALPVDDAFHFTLGGDASLRVLLLDSSPFIARALEVGSRPAFDIRRRSTLERADLAGRSLVILGEPAARTLSDEATRALVTFVREGGGVIATAPIRRARSRDAALLPVEWGENVNRMTGGGASIGFVDLDHPALFAFKQARGSDFSRARFLQYRALKPVGDSEGPRVLARFDDGREALIEADLGKGRVIAVTSPLDGVMNDLPVQPLFLPLLHELARRAADYEDRPLSHRVGTTAEIDEPEAIEEDPLTFVTSPSGRKQEATNPAGVAIEEPGFYEALRRSGELRTLGANIDVAESDLTFLPADELSAAIRPTQGSGEVQRSEPAAHERQKLWRFALLALLVLMLVEGYAANARARSTPLAPTPR